MFANTAQQPVQWRMSNCAAPLALQAFSGHFSGLNRCGSFPYVLIKIRRRSLLFIVGPFSNFSGSHWQSACLRSVKSGLRSSMLGLLIRFHRMT